MTNHSDLNWLSTSACGLIGPFAFPFQSTFQRRREGLHTCRSNAHQHLEPLYGQAFFIEAVVPPMKHIRHASLEIVEAVWELFFFSGAEDCSILHAIGANAVWELTRPITPELCPREGTRMHLERVRIRFARRYSEWQMLALKNGRFFPPPRQMELTVNSFGGVQLLLRWSAGYALGDKVWVSQMVADVSSGEPVLARHSRRICEWRLGSDL